eukprot:GHVS01050965.1.p1 GENE.GHVS01050965.1~~GHVS01050965.1.p1  ORF type:complete len:184 (+),score=26.54 GHVS01050965.1:232-783(+)
MCTHKCLSHTCALCDLGICVCLYKSSPRLCLFVLGSMEVPEACPYQPKPLSRDAWLQRMRGVDLYEWDLQEVIMNYFTVSGCEEAAAAFAEEAAIQSEMPVESMGLRKKIRQAVMTGNVTKAIACINRIEPKILEGNPELSFRLKQQQLLQLIEMGDSQQAISFAQEELAPSVKLHVRAGVTT